MKKNLFITLIGLIIITIVAILLINDKSIINTPEPVAKVGAILPLTGPAATLGEEMSNGLKLAYNDSNIELQIQDGCDPASTLSAYQALKQQDVTAIGGAFCLVGIDAITSNLNQDNMPLQNIALNTTMAESNPLISSVSGSISTDANRISNYLTNELSASSVAVIHFDTSFGQQYASNITTNFEGDVYTYSAGLDQTDYRSMLGKIKQQDPDVLLIVHFGTPLASIITQARELDLRAQLVGHYETDDIATLSKISEAAEGFIVMSARPRKPSSSYLQFNQDYLAEYENEPSYLAHAAFNSGIAMINTIKECGKNNDCIAKKLKNGKVQQDLEVLEFRSGELVRIN